MKCVSGVGELHPPSDFAGLLALCQELQQFGKEVALPRFPPLLNPTPAVGIKGILDNNLEFDWQPGRLHALSFCLRTLLR